MTILAHERGKVVRDAEVLQLRHAADMADTPCIFKTQGLRYLV